METSSIHWVESLWDIVSKYLSMKITLSTALLFVLLGLSAQRYTYLGGEIGLISARLQLAEKPLGLKQDLLVDGGFDLMSTGVGQISTRESNGEKYLVNRELSSAIDHILETPGKYVITGLPCFIKSIRLAQGKSKKRGLGARGEGLDSQTPPRKPSGGTFHIREARPWIVPVECERLEPFVWPERYRRPSDSGTSFSSRSSFEPFCLCGRF